MAIAGEVSLAQEHFEWATQTPEPSPACFLKEPLKPASEQFSSLQAVCNPVLERMLTRIADNVDVLGAVEPSVTYRLVQTLCQPFFEQVVETLSREISCVDWSDMAWQQEAEAGKQVLSLGRRLQHLEEDTTDDDSPFATLFSSDGEDCDSEDKQSMEVLSQQRPIDPKSAFVEAPRDVEKSQMVCRHWKSKGWCRYESQCKFSHPAGKRGISGKGLEDHSDVPSLPIRSTRKRGGKNKASVGFFDSGFCFANSCDMHLPRTSEFYPGAQMFQLQAQ